MPADPTIAFGILKCRDLVQLYYGARLVANIRENSQTFAINSGAVILEQDPRRIKYEIIVVSTAGAPIAFEMGSPAADDLGTDQFYGAPSGGQVVVERHFLTDLDAVCLPVELFNNFDEIQVSTREVFLTPAPVDEGP